MQDTHISRALCRIAKDMMQCKIRMREEQSKESTMTARFRPIHSSFETLRHCGLRAGHGFSASAAPANEQMTATGFARIHRPVQIFPEFVQR